MIKNIKLIFGVAAGALTVTTAATGQLFPLSENSWDNPEFRERFMGSYGFDSEINPSITATEKTVFDELVPLITEQPNAAIEQLRSYITNETSAAFDFILGNLLYQEDDMAASISAYESAVRKFPNYYRAYMNLGRAYVHLGEFAEALPHLQKAVEIKPGDATLFGLLGYCYMAGGEYTTALDAYRMAIMLNPQSRDWRLGKLRCLQAVDEHEEVIAMLYEFIRNEPDNAEWWMLQANAFLATDEVERAAANLEIVRSIGKSNTSSKMLLGDIYMNESLVEAALAVYQEALESGDLQAQRAFRVVDTLLQLAEFEHAARFLGQIESVFGSDLESDQNARMMNLQARIALANDDEESAASILEEIVSKDPMNGQALLTLADLRLRAGDMAEAELFAENASKLEDYAHRAFLMLGQMKVQQRDYSEAANYLREAQRIQPQTYVAEYLARVEQAAARM